MAKALIAEALEGPQVGFDPEQYLDGQIGFYVRLQAPPYGSTRTVRCILLRGTDVSAGSKDRRVVPP